MITVNQTKNALSKLARMDGMKEYREFMTNDVKAILLTKFLNDETDRIVRDMDNGSPIFYNTDSTKNEKK